MKRYLLIILLSSFLLSLFSPVRVQAIEDPTKISNNKVGMHILFPSEIEDAAKLVNSNGGEWGYVTIPIQSGDRDLEKWQYFFDECRRLKVIPLVRLATEGDYFNTKVWRTPKEQDVVDFANFLNSLIWPVKNRYVIIFNEVNRGDEWGGSADPGSYAELLSYSVSVFKSKSDDFFVINSGLDNAAPNKGTEYMNQYIFMREMNERVPGIFAQIDGLSSHSYPNPGFEQPPTQKTPMSVSSFIHERELARSLGGKELPVFITETGWTSEKISDQQRAEYYNIAFNGAWSDVGVIAVTPFLLHAVGGPFAQFSFLREDGSQTEQYKSFVALKKVKGLPSIGISKESVIQSPESAQKIKRNFTSSVKSEATTQVSTAVKFAVRWIFKL